MLKKQIWGVWTGFIWLRLEANDKILYTHQRTTEFQKQEH